MSSLPACIVHFSWCSISAAVPSSTPRARSAKMVQAHVSGLLICGIRALRVPFGPHPVILRGLGHFVSHTTTVTHEPLSTRETAT